MKRIIAVIIAIGSIAMITFGLCKLLAKQEEYKESESYYETLTVSKDTSNPTNTKDNNEAVEWVPDFTSLSNENPDIRAWIKFPNTSIDYPVVQGTDNSFYLKHLFNKERNRTGTLFISFENTKLFQKNTNTIVYGHNMRDGSMFASLNDYQNSYQVNTNPTFDLYLLDGSKREYQIWNVAIVNGTDDIYQTAFENEKQVAAYVSECKKKQLYKINVDPNILDATDLVTLSTCTNRNQKERIVVQGVFVKQVNESRNVIFNKSE